MNNDNTKDRVIKKLNSEFGNDVKSLSKCEELVNRYAEEKETIEKEVTFLFN